MMNAQQNATVSLYPKRSSRLRLFALWYFAGLMIVWNIAGHTFLGFEQSWAHPIVAILAAILTQLLLEGVDARATNRDPRYSGGLSNFVNFLPPPMISGFACAMLLYPNERLMPIVFAAVLSIASKVLIRVRLGDGRRTHVLNPSNVGIVATLLLFPAVGMAPPYHFTENITGLWHWVLPGAIMFSGIVVHGFATGRLPLCLAWLGGFFIQGIVRAWLADDAWYVPLTPMSSTGFILFTLYMIPDPATTPILRSRQILFGASIAVAYAFFQSNHIVFGLFLSLATVTVARGVLLAVLPSQWIIPMHKKTNTHVEPYQGTDNRTQQIKNEIATLTPRVTFQDTNLVGNVYFLTFFRWQIDCRDNWLRTQRPEIWQNFVSGSQSIAITNWCIRFEDPIGATICDDIEVSLCLNGLWPISASTYVTKRVNGVSTRVASGSMKFGSVTVSEALQNELPIGPSYSFVASRTSALELNSIELLSWQGKCRELFLADHATATLQRVATRNLILHTTTASIELFGVPPTHCEHFSVEMRLETLKCGQMGVCFDYFFDESNGRVRFAKGHQKMSCKEVSTHCITPCPIPADILHALKRFTNSDELLAKIEDILNFDETRQQVTT